VKVRLLLPRAVHAARTLLADAGVRGPRDIHPELLAARRGAMVCYGPMRTAAGALVRAGDHAVIWVDERDRHDARGRFTVLHELGHLLLHGDVDHFRQCVEGAPWRDGRRRYIEREANHFAAETAMPEDHARPLCAAARPTLDDVERLMATFRTSLQASAIRYVELATAPCAFVFSDDGRHVSWAPESAAFPGAIENDFRLHPKSLAAQVASARGGEMGPREVPGVAWGGTQPFVEHAIALGQRGPVVSWVVPA
jgi:Zn-dependent peptidase ImmA (M78 family)